MPLHFKENVHAFRLSENPRQPRFLSLRDAAIPPSLDLAALERTGERTRTQVELTVVKVGMEHAAPVGRSEKRSEIAPSSGGAGAPSSGALRT